MAITAEARVVAHLELLKAWEEFKENHLTGKSLQLEVQLLFCNLYNKRKLTFDFASLDVYGIIPRLSRSKLLRDIRRFAEMGAEAFMSLWGGRRKSVTQIEDDLAIKQAVEECIATGHTCWSPAKIKQVLETQYFLDWIPSERQIRTYLSKFKKNNYLEWQYYRSKDDFKNQSQVSFGSYAASQVNECWELDGSPFDLMLDVDGKQCRYQAIAIIDRFSRNAEILVAPSESSENSRLLIRNAILAHGLPKKIVTDNGSGFVSIQTQAFLARLGIDLEILPPACPQKKPYIERFFRTFQNDLELLPGYLGHNVAERQLIRQNSRGENNDKLMTPSDFQRWCNQWLGNYRTTYHTGLKDTPINIIASAARDGFIKQSVDVRALDFLLLDSKARSVNKNGIQVSRRFYIAPELGALAGDKEKKVYICFNPQEPEQIFVYKDELLKEFVCIATWTESGLHDRAEVQARAKEAQKEVMAKAHTVKRKAAKLEKKLENDPYSILQENTVTPFVKAVEAISETLEAVQQGLSATEPKKPVEPTEEELKRQEEAAVRYAAEKQRIEKERQENDVNALRERFRELVLLKKDGLDHQFTEEDRMFYEQFRKTPMGMGTETFVLKRNEISGRLTG